MAPNAGVSLHLTLREAGEGLLWREPGPDGVHTAKAPPGGQSPWPKAVPEKHSQTYPLAAVLGLLLFNYLPPSGTQTTLSEGTRRVQEPLPEAWSTVLTAELGVQLVSQSDYNQLL